MRENKRIIWACCGIALLLGIGGCASRPEAGSNNLASPQMPLAENLVTLLPSPTPSPWLITRTPSPATPRPPTLSPSPVASQTVAFLSSPTPSSTVSVEAAWTATSTPGAIDWTEAGKYVGQSRVICGPVAGTHYASSSRGKPTFLNIGEDYPSPRRFVVLIWGEYRRNFPEPPESLYQDKIICVSGIITEYKGVFEVEIRSPNEVTIP